MKGIFLLLAVFAMVVSIRAEDIKERLRQLRDTRNINPEKLVTYITNHHERRMEKLAELLEDRQNQLRDHDAGHRRLAPEDHERVNRQAKNFERKLTQLKNLDPTEHSDMIQHEAEALFKLNSVDYLDFELKK